MPGSDAKADAPATQAFVFNSKIFDMPAARFSLAPDDTPVLNIKVGELNANLTFATVTSSFPVSDEDKDMLALVAKGLRHVREIRPGDTIPSEVLDGSASWAIDPAHGETARKRLTVQLVGWFTGEPVEALGPDQLARLATDPKVTERVTDAFQKAAANIGTDKDGVLERIETLVRELGYIEALRERFAGLRGIDQSMSALLTHFHGDQTTCESIQRIRSLMRSPLARFQTIFEQIDAMTGEVLAALKNVDAQIAFIRKGRDELWGHYMHWQPLVEEARALVLARSPACQNFIRQVYQLVASRYPQGQSWR